jgi:hypothetical protein
MPSEMPLAQQMPDDPSDPDPNAHENMSDEQIEAALRGAVPDPFTEGLAEETPAAEVPVEAPVEEPAVETAPVAEVPVEEPPVPTEAEIEAEARKLEMEKLQARLDMQQAHSARLAGELGYLRKQATATPAEAAPAFETESDPGLVSRVEALEKGKNADARDSAVASVVADFRGRPDVFAVIQSPEFRTASEKYAAEWQQALDAPDPTSARLLASAVIGNAVAEAREIQFQARRVEAEKRRADQSAVLRQRKLAAAPPSNTAPTTRPVSKAPHQLPDKELDAYIDARLG